MTSGRGAWARRAPRRKRLRWSLCRSASRACRSRVAGRTQRGAFRHGHLAQLAASSWHRAACVMMQPFAVAHLRAHTSRLPPAFRPCPSPHERQTPRRAHRATLASAVPTSVTKRPRSPQLAPPDSHACRGRCSRRACRAHGRWPPWCPVYAGGVVQQHLMTAARTVCQVWNPATQQTHQKYLSCRFHRADTRKNEKSSSSVVRRF